MQRKLLLRAGSKLLLVSCTTACLSVFSITASSKGRKIPLKYFFLKGKLFLKASLQFFEIIKRHILESRLRLKNISLFYKATVKTNLTGASVMKSVNTQFRWMTEFCSAGPRTIIVGRDCLASWCTLHLHMATSFLTWEISSNLSPPGSRPPLFPT